MDTWETESDFFKDIHELCADQEQEVNEDFWILDSSNEAPEAPSKPSDRISIVEPQISSAAKQTEIQYNILADMSKANIVIEPDYTEILGKKHVSESFKETNGFQAKNKNGKRTKFRPLSSSEDRAYQEKPGEDWQPVDQVSFTVQQHDFPELSNNQAIKRNK